MTITLLTATPRSGKTSYAVWHVIKPALDTGRIVYTCGIPQLKLDTIKVSYADLKKWSERQFNEELEEDELLNFPNGCLIVVDEAWRLWHASGVAKPPDDIEYLALHGHHNIDFLIITQKPNLLHRAVISHVSRHLHILPTWSGRKLLEWPEYVVNPSAKTNRDVAVTTPYKVPKESFDLYHSAQGHTKLVQKKPWQLYVVLLLFLSLPVIVYYTYQNVFSSKNQEEEQFLSENTLNKEIVVTNENEIQPLQKVEIYSSYPTLVSNKYDWNRISACVASDNACVCYGHSAERLMIPKETCIIATQHGWPSERVRPSELPKPPEVTSVSTEI